MTPDQQRVLHHAREDPHLRFFIHNSQWLTIEPSAISPVILEGFDMGLVTYPSGEILCTFGDIQSLPFGTFFMNGPEFLATPPRFDKRKVINDPKQITIIHGESPFPQKDSNSGYSTRITNHTSRKIKVVRFAPLNQVGLLGQIQDDGYYYSARQFQEWFRVPDSNGWIHPGESVCDPDNYGNGRGVWAYFFEDKFGTSFIVTAPLERN